MVSSNQVKLLYHTFSVFCTTHGLSFLVISKACNSLLIKQMVITQDVFLSVVQLPKDLRLRILLE